VATCQDIKGGKWSADGSEQKEADADIRRKDSGKKGGGGGGVGKKRIKVHREKLWAKTPKRRGIRSAGGWVKEKEQSEHGERKRS